MLYPLYMKKNYFSFQQFGRASMESNWNRISAWKIQIRLKFLKSIEQLKPLIAILKLLIKNIFLRDHT